MAKLVSFQFMIWIELDTPGGWIQNWTDRQTKLLNCNMKIWTQWTNEYGKLNMIICIYTLMFMSYIQHFFSFVTVMSLLSNPIQCCCFWVTYLHGMVWSKIVLKNTIRPTEKSITKLKMSSKYGQVKRTLTKAIKNKLFYYIRKSMATRRFPKH